MKLTEKKETLPLDFITAMVGKGQDEIGTLKATIDSIKKEFSNANDSAEILQDLLDAYLICVGRLENQLNNKKYLDMPKEENLQESLFDTEPTTLVLAEPVETAEAAGEPNTDCVATTAEAVMAAYQNANKQLDSVKEVIYTKFNCPFFSSFVHNLAHTMPGRFDAFGDILHTINMEIPYPATAEIEKLPNTLQDSFTVIFECLDGIKAALNSFIICTDEKYHGMSCAAETCLNDIESEYPMLYRLQAKANECAEDTVSFDKFVGQYVEHKDDLLESLEEDSIAESKETKDSFEYFTDFDDIEIDKNQPSLHEQWINK